ncbi:hypothetical protein CJ030_MR4G025313 [Morella rubra]|uniref:Late embryogenesis abundant protein LEA-2 subgroup domain-containing protein n=1 Tax=Morella rubra TaxID=262757 RepID=A0A6A1VTX5_9ROSI|nr:hypothetical protein CJ030_MR4G025313 [Morella rubra]
MADELPFARSRIYQRSNEEIAMFRQIKKERSNKCFVYVFAGIVIMSIVALVFALIVLRPRTPHVNLMSVTAKNLRYNGAASSPSLNSTLVAEMTVHNINFGRFEFENSTMSVLYGSLDVGDGKIGPGSVRARESQRMNVTVEVRSDRVSDIEAGMLKLNCYAELSGRVRLLHIIKKRKTADMNCAMTLNLTSGAFQDLQC